MAEQLIYNGKLYKVGGKVRRINGQNGRMKEGDIGVITRIDADCQHVYVDNDDTSYHVPSNLVVVEPASSKTSSKTKDLKKVTHVVIWDEGRDPCKMFTSEKEAINFVKELSDRANVDKNSILLIEVKQARKVVIEKRLKFSEYKTC